MATAPFQHADAGDTRLTAEDRLSPERARTLIAVTLLWAAGSVLMLISGWANVRDWRFPDPDDAMRLMQVRDLLAGQSWFDVTQYRLNPPAGGPMHWSRIVDLPIAAVILLTRPLLGAHSSETAALIIIPLITLGAAMLLVWRIAEKLLHGRAALLAVAATPVSLGALTQMKLMRIDHHGWQIVLALAALLSLLGERRRRAGIGAGIALATWLNISVEGLPFVAACCLWLGLEWIADARSGERLRSFMPALAASSVLLFALTHLPSKWFAHPHDVLNIAHLGGFTAAAAGVLIVVRSEVESRWARLLLLGGVAIGAVALMFAIDPHFLAGPFSSLDPLVANQWYSTVAEGQPVWSLPASSAAAAMAQPLVGLAGVAVALAAARDEDRRPWATYGFLLLASTLCALIVIREVTAASILALPGTAYLSMLALGRARLVERSFPRVLATFVALLIMMPAYAVPGMLMAAPVEAERPTPSPACLKRQEIAKLDALAPSNLAMPLDITPYILASTGHRAIAGGYHRNDSGIHDDILLFAGPLQSARNVLAKRHIDYVVYCANTPETVDRAQHGPRGLAAMLNKGRAPEWLQPIDLQMAGLRVFRVSRAGAPA